jgi:hypothetical protein
MAASNPPAWTGGSSAPADDERRAGVLHDRAGVLDERRRRVAADDRRRRRAGTDGRRERTGAAPDLEPVAARRRRQPLDEGARNGRLQRPM